MDFIGILRSFVAVLFLSLTVIHTSSGNVVCENLPVINNGQLLLEGREPPFMEGDAISYRCDEDYRSEQLNPKVTCVVQEGVASWTEGTCRPVVISCHDPGHIENADRFGNVFTFPNNITYKCKEGFRMKGTGIKFCSRTGQWQPPQPLYCEAIICPALSDPPNGKVHFNRRVKSLATYECDRNFNLVGNSVRICQAEGTWNGSNPICKEITCMDPGKLPNGRIIARNQTVFLASDIVIFQCNDGTHLTSKCLGNGEWSARPPICAPTGKEVEPTADPTMARDIEVEPPTDATTATDIDVGPVTDRTEGKNGKEVTLCEDPGEIKNGNATFVGFHINSTVTYTCDEGYELRGKSTLLCLESGKWDLDKLPICVEPLSVPAVIGIVFGVIIFVGISVGGYFWYRYRMRSIRGYGEKSKALTADAADTEEIAGLDRDKKQIPVTVL